MKIGGRLGLCVLRRLFIVRAEHERKVPVVIERATAEDLKITSKAPKWQTDWTSEYLADEKIEKYSLKTK